MLIIQVAFALFSPSPSPHLSFFPTLPSLKLIFAMRARLALSALACLLSASPALAGLDNVTPSIDEGVGISVHAREPASGPTPQPAINATAACTEIGKKIGTAKVYYPG